MTCVRLPAPDHGWRFTAAAQPDGCSLVLLGAWSSGTILISLHLINTALFPSSDLPKICPKRFISGQILAFGCIMEY